MNRGQRSKRGGEREREKEVRAGQGRVPAIRILPPGIATLAPKLAGRRGALASTLTRILLYRLDGRQSRCGGKRRDVYGVPRGCVEF
jgi:hypothetical protein